MQAQKSQMRRQRRGKKTFCKKFCKLLKADLKDFKSLQMFKKEIYSFYIIKVEISAMSANSFCNLCLS